MNTLNQGVDAVKDAYGNVSDKVSDTYNNVSNKMNKDKNKEALMKTIEAAITDQSLTAAEMEEIEKARQEWDITEEEMSQIKVKAFKQAITQAREDIVVSDRDMELINQLEAHFKFSTAEYDAIKSELDRVRRIYAIQQGNFEPITVSEFSLESDEVCYWAETSDLVEVKSDFVAKAPKRFDANTSYTFGDTKGVVFPIQENKILGKGKLYLTNQRVVFHSPDKQVRVKLKNLTAFEPFSNGINIYEGKSADKIKYETTRNAEIIAFILQTLIKQ